MQDFYGFSSQPVSAGPSHTILAGVAQKKPEPPEEPKAQPKPETHFPDAFVLPFKKATRKLQYLQDVKLFLTAAMNNVDARIAEVEQEILLEGENEG